MRNRSHRTSHNSTKFHQKTGGEIEVLCKAVKEKLLAKSLLAFYRTEESIISSFSILMAKKEVQMHADAHKHMMVHCDSILYKSKMS